MGAARVGQAPWWGLSRPITKNYLLSCSGTQGGGTSTLTMLAGRVRWEVEFLLFIRCTCRILFVEYSVMKLSKAQCHFMTFLSGFLVIKV